MSKQAKATKLLVTASQDSPELKVLDQIKSLVDIVAMGRNVDELSHLSDDDWASVEVLLICGVGERAAKKADIQAMWPKLKGLRWIHSSSAGLDALLFRELIDSDITVTNARGVYSHSLAEYALSCCLWFAKDLPRMRAAQAQKRWDQYEVEELRGKTLGLLGYGDINQSTAMLAKAFKMRIIAAHAVFINIGRGKCVDEEALVAALQQGKIRGAGLDVFYTEPLPDDSPMWGLDNVFMSAHTADRTKEFQAESMQLFCESVQKYVKDGELVNVVDKSAGY